MGYLVLNGNNDLSFAIVFGLVAGGWRSLGKEVASYRIQLLQGQACRLGCPPSAATAHARSPLMLRTAPVPLLQA